MREIVYYSSTAITKGNFGDDLMKAGRMDIALHSIIASFFISNEMRNDTKLHLVFDGPPDPTKHLELEPQKNSDITLSKKDLLWVIKKLLYKYKKKEKFSPFNGYSIEKKSLLEITKEISETKKVYILDEKGEDIRNLNISGDEAFVLGDQDGIPKKIMKELKKKYEVVSVGKKQYLASQVITLIHNEWDRKILD